VNMDSEAQKDLTLNAEDAENVVGGFRAKRAQKKAQKKATQVVASAAPSSIMIVEPPMGPNSGPEPDGAAQSDDPDC
jgi:hypothetical protein